MFFDDRYQGKPLVFVGTVGLIPRTLPPDHRLSYQKRARPGDYIVMVGGRVGLDGIHGATFSSEGLNEGSPATAVQIGDPITQKKLSDALVKEARDRGLYTSITDNGAGGLSCSVAEMAKESGGFVVQLERIPLKYPGLSPWQIWISESQERMTLAVPPDQWEELRSLLAARGVEATVIGTFTDSGRCIVEYHASIILDMSMEFLHDGLPPRPLETDTVVSTAPEPRLPMQESYTDDLLHLLQRYSLSSMEFVSQQYDHEVQAGSVLKPLQGRGRVNAEVTITRPVLTSSKGVGLSQGLYPRYSDIDTYHMAASSIDTAIRNLVAAGISPDKIALLDNFCWCSANEPARLYQLKQAVEACYDYAVAYHTPYISGKDSMFNDFTGYSAEGHPVKISVPPTLLISSIGIIDDVSQAISIDTKFVGDLVYVLGATDDELGGSEYYAMKGFVGSTVPCVDAELNCELYHRYHLAVQQQIIASAISVTRGGLAVAFAKMAMAGKRGLQLELDTIPGSWSSYHHLLFSESQGRIVVTVAPQYKTQFETIMAGQSIACIGTVSRTSRVVLLGTRHQQQLPIVDTCVEHLLKTYRSGFSQLL
jgi:phosphoribosylformylglycinamidine synthase